eukprot:4306881-Prymnesium_polylepis.1
MVLALVGSVLGAVLPVRVTSVMAAIVATFLTGSRSIRTHNRRVHLTLEQQAEALVDAARESR